MEHKRFGDTCYIRLDRGDEVISSILEVCRAERVESATFSGIGGCSEARIQTFIPEAGTFEERTLSGMLELVSLTGNVISDDQGALYPHATPRSPTKTATSTAWRRATSSRSPSFTQARSSCGRSSAAPSRCSTTPKPERPSGSSKARRPTRPTSASFMPIA